MSKAIWLAGPFHPHGCSSPHRGKEGYNLRSSSNGAGAGFLFLIAAWAWRLTLKLTGSEFQNVMMIDDSSLYTRKPLPPMSRMAIFNALIVLQKPLWLLRDNPL
jgi:hypothetical protein